MKDDPLRFFEFEHLPQHLQTASSVFWGLARIVVDQYPDSDQRRLALQHLLQSKDAAVRCALDKAARNKWAEAEAQNGGV